MCDSDSAAEGESRQLLDSGLHGLLRYSWAPAIPVLCAVVLISLTIYTQILATGAGHCDLVIDGRLEHISIPTVSSATRLPPERWVWSGGVLATWVLLLCPSLWLVWQVQKGATLPPRGCILSAPISSQMFLIMASLGLLGEALIPIQEDFADVDALHTMNLKTSVHLLCADCMFLSAFAHGIIVIFWQANCCRERRRPPGCASFSCKALLIALVLLTVSGPAPFLLLRACPSDLCGTASKVRETNAVGIAQRTLIFLMLLFLASYGFDVHALQQSKGLHTKQIRKYMLDDAGVHVDPTTRAKPISCA